MTSEARAESRKIWQGTWGYTESILVVVGIALVGMLLQITCGTFDFFILTNSVNIIVGLAIFVLSLSMGLLYRRSKFIRWFSGVPMSVSLICAMLCLTIVMGLTPQISEGTESKMALGFDSMTSNWSFVLLYTTTILSLGATTTRRLIRFKLRDTPFLLQHAGLWITLLSSGIGYADMERYIMYVKEGEVQWRVYDSENNVKELPIAIKLNDFDMSLYPPRLAIIDRNTGEVQPTGKPQYFQIDPDVTNGKLANWNISTKEYIHQAVRGADSTFRHVPMPGSTPAAKIVVSQGEQQLSGWISAGNQLQPHMTLALNDKYSVVMTPADPREYVSHVEIYSEQGDAIEAEVRVNHPINVGNWKIYQYGYDNTAGALSTYSSFELIYDRWLLPVYVGIILIMIGALSMILLGRNRVIRRAKNDME